MKRIIAAIIVITVMLTFCSCGKDMGRLNYNYNMSKCVELDSYVIEVDSASDEYKEYYSEKITELLVGKVSEGEVMEGDSANIDYVGKKDGKAFDGGTAKGYDLIIGSDSFIDGFEDGLIGVAIGSTVDLNLTFPSDYSNTELAGQAVVFTVTVNYVNRTFTELSEETAKFCGFKSAKEVADKAVVYAKESVAWDTVYEKAVIKEYPEKETEKYVDVVIKSLNNQILQSSGVTIEQYLSYNGMTMEAFEEQIRNGSDVESMAHNYATAYYVLDAEGVKITTDMVDETIKNIGSSAVSTIGRDYFEAVTALEKAITLVGEKAVLK